MLQYNGLYVSDLQGERENMYYSYIRFYEDGMVIQVSSIGNPSEVIRWFHRDNSDLSRGFFAAEDNRIHFAVTSESGVVVYTGEFTDAQLKLSFYSHINGNTDFEEYGFVAV